MIMSKNGIHRETDTTKNKLPKGTLFELKRSNNHK